MGAGKWGTNEDAFVDLFSSHSAAEMKVIAETYDRLFGSSLHAAVKSEFSGSIKDALLNLLDEPIDFYCRQLKDASVDRIGTDEGTICRIIGGNNKATVHLIAQRYFEKYNKVLVEELRGELSGDFREAVVTYISTSDITGGLEELIKQVQFLQVEEAPAPAPEPAPAPVVAPPIRMEQTESTPSPAKAAPPAAAASPNTPPEAMTGWGVKEGHIWKTWKRRFFVLESDSSSTTIKYYAEEIEDLKGEINIRNYNVNTINADGTTALFLSGRNQDDKTLTIKLEGNAQREAWFEACTQHIAYRKRMDDQQRARQLRDL
jgi:hypothetical protein